MTLASTKSSITLLGNGVNKTWDFDFTVWATGQVAVWLTDPDGVASEITSNFSVALNADQSVNPGGTVTYPVSGDAIATGYSLSILRDMEFVQPVDLQKNQGFDPTVLEAAMDQATAERQQLKEIVERAIVAAPNQTPEDFLGGLLALRDAASSSASASEASRLASGVSADEAAATAAGLTASVSADAEAASISAAGSEAARLAAEAARNTAESWAIIANPAAGLPMNLNKSEIAVSITVPADYNAVSGGPMSISDAATVTVENGATWSIV